MPLLKRGLNSWRFSDLPVSYKVNPKNRSTDARNVLSNQGVLETRPGYTRFNDTTIEEGRDVTSLSAFKDLSDNLLTIAKVNTSLYKVPTSGASTAIKTGLTVSKKHRAVTFRDRHLIVVEGDGVFQWDGTTFGALGQAGGSAPTVGSSGAGNTLTAADYKVAYTFHSTTTGFESNLSTASALVTVASGEQIDISGMDTSVGNFTIDKKRIYLKDITNNSAWIFWDEIDLGDAADTIDDDPLSTDTAPTTNGTPPADAKFIVTFGKSIALAGVSANPSDVFISEPYIPDAFDNSRTSKTIKASGKGPVTGLGVGFYDNDNLRPFLCIFKRNSVEVYSEIGGIKDLGPASTSIGCIGHDTIVEEAGIVKFMSTTGWYEIANGQLRKRKVKGRVVPAEIADGDLIDIFTRPGYVYELNKTNYSNFFSVFFPGFKGNYMTFISEGVSTTLSKCYNYEFDVGGFRPLEFALNFFDAVHAELSTGEDAVLLAGANGFIYKYSMAEDKHDVDIDNDSVDIDAFFDMFWFTGQDFESSYNFGSHIVRAVEGDDDITVNAHLDYAQNTSTSSSFSRTADGFQLGVSKLDEGVLTDGRRVTRNISEILRTGQSLLLKYSQSATDANMSLIEGQVHVSKNGCPN